MPGLLRGIARTADDMNVKLALLRGLGELKSQGVLTEEEFAAQKSRILGS
jgi:Short C-terminal domain